MSRQIRFRAWDSENNKFLWTGFDKHLTESHEDKPQNIRKGNLILPIGDGIVWQQCTGLKDKNGLRIYEGDILHSEKGHTGTVVWIDAIASFAVECEDGKWALNEGDVSRPSILTYTSVIGNIFEHSDLLTPKSVAP
jgi:uncharacterized phage protein (TIGR01671 family)